MTTPPTLNRQALSRALALRMRIPIGDSALILEEIFNLITDQLVQGGRVEFEKFIRLEVVTRSYRQPERAGSEFDEPTRVYYNVVRLKASRELRNLLRQQK